MISTNDFKNGMTIDLPEGLFQVVEFQHVKPGKGGAFVRTKLRNVRLGTTVERTFRADEKVEQAVIDKREMQYLYAEGGDLVFMDTTSYDQMHVSPKSLGDAAGYLLEGNTAILQMYKTEIVGVDLPAAVEIEGHPVLQVVGADGHRRGSLGALVRRRHPVVVTTRVSSMRTPPCSGR